MTLPIYLYNLYSLFGFCHCINKVDRHKIFCERKLLYTCKILNTLSKNYVSLDTVTINSTQLPVRLMKITYHVYPFAFFYEILLATNLHRYHYLFLEKLVTCFHCQNHLFAYHIK